MVAMRGGAPLLGAGVGCGAAGDGRLFVCFVCGEGGLIAVSRRARARARRHNEWPTGFRGAGKEKVNKLAKACLL